VTRTTPTEDKNLYSKRYLLSELSVMLAGRAAEEIFFGKEEITTGASNDFERANKTIRNMLTKF
jgi:cell division protease FtsH